MSAPYNQNEPNKEPYDHLSDDFSKSLSYDSTAQKNIGNRTNFIT